MPRIHENDALSARGCPRARGRLNYAASTYRAGSASKVGPHPAQQK